MHVIPAVVLVIGAAICGLPDLVHLADVPPAEYAAEARAKGAGALFLFSPYMALAGFSRRTTVRSGLVALTLLVVGSAVFFVGASMDAQGGLVAIFIVPLQWLVAVYAGDERFLRPGARAHHGGGVTAARDERGADAPGGS